MSTIDQAIDLVKNVESLVKTDLAPISNDVDRKGLYPRKFLQKLGAMGGFATAISATLSQNAIALSTQVDIIREVARECGSTAFLVWCQSACVTYLLRSPNPVVRERYLEEIAYGRLLAGTGMSNAVKHLAGIEDIRLKAVRTDEGYTVSGSLPWVSNIDDSHLTVVAAEVADGGYIMFAMHCNAEGVSLHPCPEFAGLEGTQTLNIRLKNVLISNDDVIAQPDQFKAYIQRIKPTFVLSQVGMGLGIIDNSLRTIRESNVVNAHVNEFLDDQDDELTEALLQLESKTRMLATQADNQEVKMIDILRLRLATSELTLKAANSAVLHAGARGYLMRHPAQRRLREAVFVAIVTPALKHLRKEIHAFEQQEREAQAA